MTIDTHPELFEFDPHLRRFVAEQIAANIELRRNGLKLPKPGSIKAETLRHARLYHRDGSLRPTQVAWARDEAIETAHGPVLTRVFAAAHPTGVVAHFHGGGWALGSLYEQDVMLAAWAEATAATWISIDYPLAPESVLPATLTVAAAALAELVDRHRDLPVCVAGESAGAQVALQSVLRLKDRPKLFRHIRALSLSYGIYDLSMTPSQRSWGSDFLGLSSEWLEWFYALALPGLAREARSDPALSPLYSDLTGLPPALLIVGTLDPLLDDSLFLAQRWRAVGSAATLRVYPEAPHGFNHMGTAMAAHCNADVANFLAAHIRP